MSDETRCTCNKKDFHAVCDETLQPKILQTLPESKELAAALRNLAHDEEFAGEDVSDAMLGAANHIDWQSDRLAALEAELQQAREYLSDALRSRDGWKQTAESLALRSAPDPGGSKQ